QAEADIVVFVRALSVHADALQSLGKSGVISEDRAAVAKAAERFCREEAGCGREAKRAEATALIARTKALRGVIEHEQSLGFGDRGDRIMVGGLTEQIDRDYRPRLQA